MKESTEDEVCQICGNAYAEIYHVPDDVWEAIKPPGKVEGAGLLCPRCADSRARENSITLYWEASSGWWKEDVAAFAEEAESETSNPDTTADSLHSSH